MATTLHHWTNGATFEGTSGRFSDVTNPATGEVTAQLALASEADVESVVAAAAAAYPAWRDTSLAKRSQVLFAFRELLNAHKPELAAIFGAVWILVVYAPLAHWVFAFSGFAAETGDADGDVLHHARAKLARKGCDVLVANEVGDGVTFGQDSSTAHLLRRGSDDVVTVGPAPKSHIAAALLDLVADLVPGERLATAYGVFATAQGLGALGGGALAGGLYEHHLGLLIAIIAGLQAAALVTLVLTVRIGRSPTRV